jgi:hypothetical protein
MVPKPKPVVLIDEDGTVLQPSMPSRDQRLPVFRKAQSLSPLPPAASVTCYAYSIPCHAVWYKAVGAPGDSLTIRRGLVWGNVLQGTPATPP